MRAVINSGLLVGDLTALGAVLYGEHLFLCNPTRPETAAICVAAGLIGWSLTSLVGQRIDSLTETARDIEPRLGVPIGNIPQHQR